MADNARTLTLLSIIIFLILIGLFIFIILYTPITVHTSSGSNIVTTYFPSTASVSNTTSIDQISAQSASTIINGVATVTSLIFAFSASLTGLFMKYVVSKQDENKRNIFVVLLCLLPGQIIFLLISFIIQGVGGEAFFGLALKFSLIALTYSFLILLIIIAFAAYFLHRNENKSSQGKAEPTTESPKNPDAKQQIDTSQEGNKMVNIKTRIFDIKKRLKMPRLKLSGLKLRRHFYLTGFSVGLAILLLLGVLPVYFVAWAPSTIAESDFYGFAIARNETGVVPTGLELGLNVDPPQLYFSYSCQFNATGKYYFVFVFPFRFEQNLNGSTSWGDNGYAIQSKTSEHCSIVTVEYTENDTSAIQPTIGESVAIDQTFKTGSKGQYTVIFPFDSSAGGIPTNAVSDYLDKFGLNDFSPLGVDYLTLQVSGLPSDAVLTNEFPQISRGPVTGNSVFGDKRSYVEWQLSPYYNSVSSVMISNLYGDNSFYTPLFINSVILNYSDPLASEYYGNLLFIGGIFFGIGSAIVTTVIYDFFKERHKKATKYDYD